MIMSWPTANRGDIMMEYSGYIGNVEFDNEADIFHGEVINLRDVVTFQVSTVAKLRKSSVTLLTTIL